MPRDLSLSLFFPAYNEEANIRESVMQADTVLRTLVDEYEIIVINDGSKDATGSIADMLAKQNKHVRVVHHNPNQGYGGAVISGIKAATKDYVFFTDADLQFDLKEIKKLLKFVPEYDVVLGYRAKRRDPIMRLANAKAWNLLNRILFGLKVKDIDCAFKLFKRDVIQSVPIKSRGAMISAEFLIRLQRKDIKFKEVAVTHLPRTAGSPTGAKPAVIMRAFRELIQMYRGDLGNVTQRQAIKFGLVGLANTLLDLLTYLLLTRTIGYFSEHVLVAKASAYLLGSILSFSLNRWWTFKKSDPVKLIEVIRFYVSVAAAVLINITSLFIFLRLFSFQDLPAVVAATLLTFGWNFVTSKFWVFATRTHKRTSPPFLTPSWDWLGLAVIITVVAINGWYWLAADNYPPHWDMANHLRNSLTYTDAFHRILDSTTVYDMAKAIYYFFVKLETYYPPFTYWISVPFIFFAGRTFDAAAMSNAFFAITLVLAMYGIGKHMWNSTTGLLAACIALGLPIIAGQFHEFQLDMPLTVMTALAFWTLLKTERWQKPWWSVAFGITSGLAMLTKWPYPAFLIGPVLYEIIGFARSKPTVKQWRLFLGGIALSVIAFIATMGPWYFTHARSLAHNLGINWETGTGEGDPSPLSPSSLRLYSDVLIQAQLRFLWLIPITIGFITTFINKINLRKNGILFSYIIGGWIIMTIYNNKDYRFIEPILPALAIVGAFWISQIRNPWRIMASLLIVLLFIFHTLSVSWGTRIFSNLPPKIVFYVPDIQEGQFRFTLWEFTGYGSGPPRNEYWPNKELLESLVNDAESSAMQQPYRVAMYYTNTMEFNRENMWYSIQQLRKPVRILDAAPATFNCNDTDYILTSTLGGTSEAVFQDFPYTEAYVYNEGQRTKHTTNTAMCQLSTIYETQLPDGNKAILWKITKQ